MLTWREGKVLLFDAETLELKKEFEMEPTVKNEVRLSLSSSCSPIPSALSSNSASPLLE